MLPSAAALNELISASRLGVNKHTQISPEDIFSDRLDVLVARHFNSCDREWIDLIGTEGSSGLLAARTRAKETARAHFATGQRLLAKLKLNSHARKYAESMLFAQKAYELYVRRRFSNSIRLLQYSFIDDLVLEAELGFEILVMHRIQLLNNWMRIEAQRGNGKQGLALGIMQLQYLEAPETLSFGTLPPPWNQGWNCRLNKVPAALISKMHDQVAAETNLLFEGIIAAKTSPSEITSMISSVARFASSETQISRWLDFQFARFNKSLDECCFAASVALRHGSVPSSPLWLSIAECIKTLLNNADLEK